MNILIAKIFIILCNFVSCLYFIGYNVGNQLEYIVVLKTDMDFYHHSYIY